jgi:hypothetical protein
MSELRTFILAHRDRIVDAYAARNPGDWPGDTGGPRAWASAMVDELCGALEVEPTDFEMRRGDVPPARLHGSARRSSGGPIEALVGDFGALCDAICVVASDGGIDLSPTDVRTMNLFVDGNIAAALEAYACDEGDGDDSPDIDLVLAVGNAVSVARAAFDALRSGRVGINSRTGVMLERSLARLERIVSDSVAGLVRTVKARKSDARS